MKAALLKSAIFMKAISIKAISTKAKLSFYNIHTNTIEDTLAIVSLFSLPLSV